MNKTLFLSVTALLGGAWLMATEMPAGTAIQVRTNSTITSKKARVGETYTASLAEPIVVNGATVATQGSDATLRVTQVDDGGRVKGRATIGVTLVSFVDRRGRTREVSTAAQITEAKSGVKGDAVKTGVASGVGALIGAIAGGGKGAAIGAGAGAAGGAGVAMATKGPAAEIAAESRLSFVLSQPLTVRP